MQQRRYLGEGEGEGAREGGSEFIFFFLLGQRANKYRRTMHELRLTDVLE